MLRHLASIVAALALASAAHATSIRVMSFNTWHAGSRVADGEQKVIDAIVAAGADVVGLQETEGRLATAIAAALGWHALQGPGSAAIVSRFPITEVFALARDASGLGVRLRLGDAPAGDVVFWSAHLGYTDYGPYAACDGAATSTLKRGESSSGRDKQVRDVLRRMRRQLREADDIPVVLVGDFNAPSHLDWIPAAASLHCGVAMAWPVSSRLARAGLIDVFRVLIPDPVAVPGTTWSTVYPAPEPQDRIDFVYAKGTVPVSAEVFVLGTPSPHPDHATNAWPSDHAAVVATIDVTPTRAVPDREPRLALDRSSYAAAEPIVAELSGGPGNGTDWVALYHAGDVPGVHPAATWRYLNGTQSARRRGPTSATVTFAPGTLPSGAYVAHFLYADGFGALAPGVPFSVD
jgi:endonuclease/exonuclease/phosphatase family metal-dependent hydrolase